VTGHQQRRATSSDGDTGAGGTGGRLPFPAGLGAGAHVGPAGRYDRLRYEAEILAFILTAAG
jgi:hypothetical protein